MSNESAQPVHHYSDGLSDDGAANTPVPLEDLESQSFGRYRLCYRIASGGMASMYLARAQGPGGYEKLVALKRIHPHLAEQKSFVEMFLDEARIAARIAHPSVCAVVEFGEEKGTYYIAMEYVVGETLGRVLRVLSENKARLDAPNHPALIARIIADVAEGLHAAHELKGDDGTPLGVVHRDVSPQNLFVAYDGTVRIVDFGIARASGKLHQTSTGTVKGKYAYMSPEQCRSQDVDRRGDVWALGVVLWELLTGRRLFRRPNEVETIFAVVSSPIPKPSDVKPGVPADLEKVVMRALSRDVNGRYATARELGRDLNRFVARAPEPMGSADVAEWMAQIFPGGEEKLRQFVDASRDVVLVESSSGPRSGAPEEVSEERERVASPSNAPTLAAAAAPALPVKPRSTRPPPPARVPWIAMTAIAAVAVVATAALVALRPPSGDDTHDTASPPSTVLAPPAITPVRPTPTPPVAHPATPTPPVAHPATPTPPVAHPATPTPIAHPTTPVPTPIAHPTTPTPVPTPIAHPNPPVPVPTPMAHPTTPTTPPVTRPTTPRVARPTHPRPTPVPTAPAEPGTVNLITTGGWADVYEGTRRLGRTPAQLSLPAGRHTLELRPFGEGPAVRARVDVPAGGSTRTVVPLR